MFSVLRVSLVVEMTLFIVIGNAQTVLRFSATGSPPTRTAWVSTDGKAQWAKGTSAAARDLPLISPKFVDGQLAPQLLQFGVVLGPEHPHRGAAVYANAEVLNDLVAPTAQPTNTSRTIIALLRVRPGFAPTDAYGTVVWFGKESTPFGVLGVCLDKQLRWGACVASYGEESLSAATTTFVNDGHFHAYIASVDQSAGTLTQYIDGQVQSGITYPSGAENAAQLVAQLDTSGYTLSRLPTHIVDRITAPYAGATVAHFEVRNEAMSATAAATLSTQLLSTLTHVPPKGPRFVGERVPTRFRVDASRLSGDGWAEVRAPGGVQFNGGDGNRCVRVSQLTYERGSVSAQPEHTYVASGGGECQFASSPSTPLSACEVFDNTQPLTLLAAMRMRPGTRVPAATGAALALSAADGQYVAFGVDESSGNFALMVRAGGQLRQFVSNVPNDYGFHVLGAVIDGDSVTLQVDDVFSSQTLGAVAKQVIDAVKSLGAFQQLQMPPSGSGFAAAGVDLLYLEVVDGAFRSDLLSRRIEDLRVERFHDYIDPDCPWPFDVDQDGTISGTDANKITAYVNSKGSGCDRDSYFDSGRLGVPADVTRDGCVHPFDGLMIINFLNRRNSSSCSVPAREALGTLSAPTTTTTTTVTTTTTTTTTTSSPTPQPAATTTVPPMAEPTTTKATPSAATPAPPADTPAPPADDTPAPPSTTSPPPTSPPTTTPLPTTTATSTAGSVSSDAAIRPPVEDGGSGFAGALAALSANLAVVIVIAVMLLLCCVLLCAFLYLRSRRQQRRSVARYSQVGTRMRPRSAGRPVSNVLAGGAATRRNSSGHRSRRASASQSAMYSPAPPGGSMYVSAPPQPSRYGVGNLTVLPTNEYGAAGSLGGSHYVDLQRDDERQYRRQ